MRPIFLLLALVASALAAEKDITPLLTKAKWTWDHPAAKGRTLKFNADGTCEATLWKGLWKITGPHHVEITLPGDKKTELDFNEAVTEFTGVHTDGERIVGRRSGEADKDITALITSSEWKYDHPTKLGVSLRFRADRKAISASGWNAVWTQVDALSVELIMADKRKARITFDPGMKSFTGTFFDGLVFTGKRVGDVPSGLRP
jgi:hypothetical protein